MPNRARDTRKQKQYDAEGVIPHNSSPAAKRYLTSGKKVAGTGNVSIEACQAYVDHVTTSAWFQRRWGQRRIPVGHKTYGNATWDGHDISLPPWARDEATILHEIAHALVPRYIQGTDQRPAAHGPEFSAILLTLVRYQVGAQAATDLRASYSKHRVKYRAGLWAVPQPTRTVRPRSDQEASERKAAKVRKEREEAAQERKWLSDRKYAAMVIRASVRNGDFGEPGSKARRQALAAARTMEQALAEYLR